MKNCKVILLPFEGKTRLGRHRQSGDLIYTEPSVEPAFENMHIYVVSNDEIKKGDWLMSIKGENVRQCTGIQTNQYLCVGDNNGVLKSACVKIIASTNWQKMSETMQLHKYMPGIPEEFIKDYVKGNGSITNIDVAYTWNGGRAGDYMEVPDTGTTNTITIFKEQTKQQLKPGETWKEIFLIMSNPDVSQGTKEAMVMEKFEEPKKK